MLGPAVPVAPPPGALHVPEHKFNRDRVKQVKMVKYTGAPQLDVIGSVEQSEIQPEYDWYALFGDSRYWGYVSLARLIDESGVTIDNNWDDIPIRMDMLVQEPLVPVRRHWNELETLYTWCFTDGLSWPDMGTKFNLILSKCGASIMLSLPEVERLVILRLKMYRCVQAAKKGTLDALNVAGVDASPDVQADPPITPEEIRRVIGLEDKVALVMDTRSTMLLMTLVLMPLRALDERRVSEEQVQSLRDYCFDMETRLLELRMEGPLRWMVFRQIEAAFQAAMPGIVACVTRRADAVFNKPAWKKKKEEREKATQEAKEEKSPPVDVLRRSGGIHYLFEVKPPDDDLIPAEMRRHLYPFRAWRDDNHGHLFVSDALDPRVVGLSAYWKTDGLLLDGGLYLPYHLLPKLFVCALKRDLKWLSETSLDRPVPSLVDIRRRLIKAVTSHETKNTGSRTSGFDPVCVENIYRLPGLRIDNNMRWLLFTYSAATGRDRQETLRLLKEPQMDSWRRMNYTNLEQMWQTDGVSASKQRWSAVEKPKTHPGCKKVITEMGQGLCPFVDQKLLVANPKKAVSEARIACRRVMTDTIGAVTKIGYNVISRQEVLEAMNPVEQWFAKPIEYPAVASAYIRRRDELLYNFLNA